MRLAKEYYKRHATDLAPDLLGKSCVRCSAGVFTKKANQFQFKPPCVWLSHYRLTSPQGLERECRERPNFANFLDSFRIIRRLAEFLWMYSITISGLS